MTFRDVLALVRAGDWQVKARFVFIMASLLFSVSLALVGPALLIAVTLPHIVDSN